MLGESSLGSVAETSAAARARRLVAADSSRRGRAPALVSARLDDDDARRRSRNRSFANRGHPYVEAGLAFPQSVQSEGNSSLSKNQTLPDSRSNSRFLNAVSTATRAVSSAREHVCSARARDTATHSAAIAHSVILFVERVIV